jgi:serine protease Do
LPLTGLEESITSVVERATPSVVTIATEDVRRDRYGRPVAAVGTGSGVVVRPNLVATNYHVVRAARRLQVILHDGRVVPAEVVGGDAGYDLAVLRIHADDLVPLPLADSDALKVGQLAIAIGSPFGLMLRGPTVTVGVVSGLGRHLPSGQGLMENLVQTDAPINPGNSGGPLLNTQGEVIGLNTAIIPFAQGIGFAVPANVVREAVEQLIATGRIVRPWLGVAGRTVTPEAAAQYRLPVGEGVLVVAVEPDSPADRAGLEPGDVLAALDGRSVRDVEALRASIRSKRPGDRVDAVVVRGTHQRRVALEVQER